MVAIINAAKPEATCCCANESTPWQPANINEPVSAAVRRSAVPAAGAPPLRRIAPTRIAPATKQQTVRASNGGRASALARFAR
jgi:hypothetical protein